MDRGQVEGRWSDGRRVGQWQAWHENGQPWVQGEYDNNEQAQGTWQYYDPQGRPCGRAQFQGIKIGEWTEWNLQGDTIGHGSYVEGKQDGLWSFQNSSGQTVLELTFQQGVIDGPAVIHQPHRIELSHREEQGNSRQASAGPGRTVLLS